MGREDRGGLTSVQPAPLTGILTLVKFTVEIDDVLWAKIRAQDGKDEETLARLLAVALAGQVKTSTELLLVTGKVKVTR